MLERYYHSTEDFIKNLDKNYNPVDFEKNFTDFLNKLIQPESGNQSNQKTKHYPTKQRPKYGNKSPSSQSQRNWPYHD